MKPSYLIHLSLSIGYLLPRSGGQSALVGYSDLGPSSVLAYSLRFQPCGDGKVRVVSKAGLHRHSARRASRASVLERSASARARRGPLTIAAQDLQSTSAE